MDIENQTPNEETQPVKTTHPLISPVVAALAQKNKIDLNQITGSGKDGRVTKQDVLDAVRNGTARSAVPAASGTSAAVCLSLEADLNRMNRGLKAWNEQQFGIAALSPIHGILAAVLKALEHFPQVTTPVDEPVIHLVCPGSPANALPQTMLEEPLSVLAGRIQENEQVTDFSTPSFIIEDHSQTGITSVLPTLPPNQSALLAIASPQRRPVAVTNTMVIHLVVILSLVYDPRQVNPTDAAEFLAFLKRLLEEW